MRTIRYVVVHSSDTSDKAGNAVDASLESMRRYHIEHNGWNDIGYHFVVRMNGEVEYGRALAVEGAHVQGFNAETIGICCSGDGDVLPFTLAQRRTLATLCAKLCREFGLSPLAVIGHREADDHGAPPVLKRCPGAHVNLDAIRADVQLELDALRLVPRTPPLPSPPSVPFDLILKPAADQATRVEALERRVAELERLLLAS